MGIPFVMPARKPVNCFLISPKQSPRAKTRELLSDRLSNRDSGRSHFMLELSRALRPMKIEYRGYTIDVTVTSQLDGWSAKVLIWPIVETMEGLREYHEVQGYSNRVEAEHAGLQWGRKRLNLYAQGKLR